MLYCIKTDSPYLHSLYRGHGHAYEGDAGIDLFMPTQMIVPAKSLGFRIKLGICAEMRDYNIPVPYTIHSRSSMSTTPLRTSTFIIDAGYRGELSIIVDNVSDHDYIIRRGERLVQVCAYDLSPIDVRIVRELSPGSRGARGLGSSNDKYVTKEERSKNVLHSDTDECVIQAKL